jgi:hypothetical protein
VAAVVVRISRAPAVTVELEVRPAAAAVVAVHLSTAMRPARVGPARAAKSASRPPFDQQQPRSKTMKALDNYKTYIVSGTTILFTAVQLWNGSIDVSTAIFAILGALGLGALRHGMKTA